MNVYGDISRAVARPQKEARPGIAVGGLAIAAGCLFWGNYLAGETQPVNSFAASVAMILQDLRVIGLLALFAGCILAMLGRSRALQMLLLVSAGAMLFGAMWVVGSESVAGAGSLTALTFYGGLCWVSFLGANSGRARLVSCMMAGALFLLAVLSAFWTLGLQDLLLFGLATGAWLWQCALAVGD